MLQYTGFLINGDYLLRRNGLLLFKQTLIKKSVKSYANFKAVLYQQRGLICEHNLSEKYRD